MASAKAWQRLEGIDAARGIAIVLMFMSHCVKALMSFKMMPNYGIVPIHLITKFSSSLFILVFGVSVATVYLPKVNTDAWPRVRWGLIKRAFVVMFWYKVLAIVQMFENAKPQAMLDVLMWRRFPDFVEILQFYGWFILLLVIILPWWASMHWLGKILMVLSFGLSAYMLHTRFDFWGLWQLKAILVESPQLFCFGVLSRGTMALTGLLLGELFIQRTKEGPNADRLAWVCFALGLLGFILFAIQNHDQFGPVFIKLAKNWGKHPPNYSFVTFTFGGACLILAMCLTLVPKIRGLFVPFLAVGRESLFCFSYHIILIFVGYRYILGFRHDVNYPQALWLTSVLIFTAILAAAAYTQLKKSFKGAT